MATPAANKEAAPAYLRLQPCQPIDCTSLLQVPTATLTRKLHAQCLCFHPQRPLLALGAGGVVAVIDLLSGIRLGRIDLGSEPVQMCFASDAPLLIVAVAEWHIHAISLSTWRSRVLVPRRQKAEKALEQCLMVVSNSASPVVYFCKYGKELLRMAHSNTAAADPKKAGSWGTKLKLDVVKPTLGMAHHPSDAQLLLLHADGFIRGYLCQAADVLHPLYVFQVQDKIPAGMPAMGTFDMVAHPTVPGAALLLQAERLGDISVLEVSQRNLPIMLLRARVPGWAAVLGMGLHQENSVLLAFGLTDGGKVRSTAWKMLGKTHVADSLTLAPTRVDPLDLTPLLDGLGRARAQAAASTTKAASGAGAASIAWQSLWATPPTWSTDVSSSVLLDQQLAPLLARVVVHPLLGLVAAQLEPSFVVQTNAALAGQPYGQLQSEEYAVAKRTATVPLLSLVSAEAHMGGWKGGQVSPMHTSLRTWQGDSVLGGAFEFPCHFFYLTGNKIVKYAPAARSAAPIVALSADAADGSARIARHVTYSTKQSAWLVQLESLGSSEGFKDRWQWTLLLPAAFGGSAPPVWAKSGRYPTFVGPNDAHIAVIEASGKAVAVFPVATTISAAAPPTFTINLDAASISGFASPLFPGPPCVSAPLPLSAASLDTNEDPNVVRARRREAAAGAGVVLWQTADGQLAMTSLGSTIRISKLGYTNSDEDDNSSDDDEGGMAAARRAARDKAQALPPGSHLGARAREAALPLLPGEKVLQVSWQQLSETAPTSPEDVAAGVLTTHRVLLISGAMRVMASTSEAVGYASGACLPHPVTSLLWVGPALLYCTTAGQVMLLSWSGTVHPVASVAGGRHLLLAGVTPDALLLMRATDAAGLSWEPVVRPISVLQLLLQGWAGLGASGMLPSGIFAGRSAMQSLLSKFDIGNLTPGLAWTLMSDWAADVAALLSDRSSHLDGNTALAAQAAAGKWPAVTSALMAELQASPHYPRPPPRGSEQHAKLLAAAAGCIAHGQWTRAFGFLRAAGEWRSAMVVAVCQGNLAGVTQAGQDAVASRDPAEAAEARRLEGTLRGLYNTSTTVVPDATLQLTSNDGLEVPPASGWSLGSLGMTPQAETVAPSLLPPSLVGPNEVGIILTTPRGELTSFLGLGPTAAATLTVAKALRSPIDHRVSSLLKADGGKAEGLPVQKTGGSTGPAEESSKRGAPGSLLNAGHSLAKVSLDSLGLEAPMTDAQAAARADFLREAGISTGLSGDLSSDEDLDGDSHVGGTRRIKIQIRGKDEAGVAQPVDPFALKEAAKNLTLNMPPLPPKAGGASGAGTSSAAFMAGDDLFDFSSPKHSHQVSPALGGLPPLQISSSLRIAPPPPPGSMAAAKQQLQQQQSMQQQQAFVQQQRSMQQQSSMQQSSYPPSTASSVAITHDLIPDLLGSPMAPQPMAAASAATPAMAVAASFAPAPAPGVSSVVLYQQGVQLMESADWRGSAAAFGQAIATLHSEPAAASTAQRISFCAQYYAAVRLLEVAAGSASKGLREARVYRYLAALSLDDKHQVALVREAIALNKAVGNYRYAADQLTSLIAKCLETNASMEYMQQLQADIDSCDRAGGNDKDVPSSERLDAWAGRVAAATQQPALDQVVDQVLRG